MAEKMEGPVRKPAVAGAFYPAKPEELRSLVESQLAARGAEAPAGTVILAPHAGYPYSGAVAGTAFAAVAGQEWDRVVLLGTGHRAAVRGAALYGPGSFETPLGALAIDEALQAELLAASPHFEVLPQAHEGEHSIEVQLPFIQVLRGNDVRIVPILLNSAGLEALAEIGSALGRVLKGKRVLLVISSDLSHYPARADALAADASLMFSLGVAMRSGNPAYFARAGAALSSLKLKGYDTPCCGGAAVLAGARAALEMGATDFRLLRLANSSDLEGADAAATVGYGAGVFCSPKEQWPIFPLSVEQKKQLLALARSSIEHYFKNSAPPVLPLSPEPAFNAPAAVFVTLHKRGRLRGCIGTMEPRIRLCECVAAMACESAFADYRFPQLASDELDDVKIEVSVLSPLKRVNGPDDIEQGQHGVMVRGGSHSGTYLPQVWAQFASKEEFLDSLCVEKAELPAGAWREAGTELYVYTADAAEE